MAAEEENISHKDILHSIKDLARQIESAFPKDDEGNPDFTGHRLYHKKATEDKESYANSKAAIIRNIVTWAVIGVISIVGSALVQSFLVNVTSVPK